MFRGGYHMKSYRGCCNSCKYYSCDYSTGTSECNNDDITEEALDKHYTNDEPGCPYYMEIECEDDTHIEMIKCNLKYTINSLEIRDLCIKYNFYTRGYNSEYAAMLGFCDEVSNSTESISLEDAMYTIAIDIMKHSDISSFYSDKEAINFILTNVVGRALNVEIDM